MSTIRETRMGDHVIQFAVPTPTLPPSTETNTYLIYDNAEGVLVDIGTSDPDLLEQLADRVAAHGVRRIRAIVATHYHRDHTIGIPALSVRYDTDIFVHRLDLEPAAREMRLPPDAIYELPAKIHVNSTAIEVSHQPGHTHGHVHLIVPSNGVILVGDHLATDGSVWIGPPDGHIDAYYNALRHIQASGCLVAGPGHGDVIADAADASARLLTRRMAREAQLESLIAGRPSTLAELVTTLYEGVIPAEVMWVAKKTVQAHLAHLIDDERIDRIYDPQQQQFLYITHNTSTRASASTSSWEDNDGEAN